MSYKSSLITAALKSLAPPGVLLGHRIIAQGDENALLEAEATAFRYSVPRVRRQSGAARLVAREIFATLGLPATAIPRSVTGAPIWPNGIAGSFAHDDTVAVAAVANSGTFVGVGIDVEPAAPLPPELATMVATPTERSLYKTGILESRVLFVAKEAVYKAQHPVDGVFLDFQDIEIDLSTRQGFTRGGRSVAISVAVYPRILVLALISAGLG